jgi:hypothetical protein
VRGKFLRREQDAAVMLVGKAERRVPWSEFGPALLLRQGRILKQFEGDRRALEAYLLWLAGRRRDDKELKPMLAKGFPSVVDLRADLVADLDADYGLAALGLLELQQLELGDDPAAARAALVEFEQIVHRHGKHPLLQTRKTAVEQLARALAERAFTLSDAGAMGIRAQIEQLDDQRVRLRYAQPETAANLDFAPVPAEDLQLFQVTRIAYDGPTAITAAGKHWHLIGAGFLRWAVPLAGAQEIEIDFEVVGGQGDFALFLCREEGRWIWVSPDGQLQILDESTGMRDQVGKPTPLFLDKVHRLRVVHDGKKQVQTWLDGNLVATLPGVGNCLRGDLLLLVRSSEAIRLHGLVITGRLDPTDPLPLRERSVQEVLQRLWQ